MGTEADHLEHAATERMTRWNQLRRERFAAGDSLEIEAARAAVASALFAGLQPEPVCVGRYVLQRRLGAGGMGVVFTARDPSLERDVAVKLLNTRSDEPGADDLLLREARKTARLVHPNVVTIFDVGTHEGRVFITMELVDGQPMSDWLTTRPPWQHAVAVMARAARGIEAAHAQGVIHRDFKPGNVLIGWDGRVCVADFGLAREVSDAELDGKPAALEDDMVRVRSHAGEIAGTPAYMAPEQYLGTVQDQRTDQFAFCVTLYEALWGRRPFECDTVSELRNAILTCDVPTPPASDLPDVLVSAVSRGLSKSRRDRFAKMGDLATLLESLSSDVDLASVVDVPGSVRWIRGSKLEAYVQQLPEGLDTAPDHWLPSITFRLALSRKPLPDPPAILLPWLKVLAEEERIRAVAGRGILCAIYDEHFDSVADYAEFIGEICQGSFRLLFASFSLPPVSSAHFMPRVMGIYNNSMSGMEMRIVESAEHSAVLWMGHPPHTMNDLTRVGTGEMVRVGLLAAGARIGEVLVRNVADDGFELKAEWR
ncbi:MAG: serine/threonine protein kinase [Polyangiaceae bacterium]|nr:serine/threonine protein kinase [Polyangiaceae bacterium]